MADWQVYLMMTAIVAAMLLGKKLMFFDSNKKNKDKNIYFIFSSTNLHKK